MSFYEIKDKLDSFWKCERVFSYDYPMGAATFHPLCFFKTLEQKPFSISFVQPSTRKPDGRWGKSKTRFLTHHQYQVLMAPAPQNIYEMVMNSIQYLGIDIEKNQIQWIENNWESPTLGAFGKGYEILCNTMEILQFTYFQVMADIPLKLIPVELAYGMERLSFFLSDNIMNMPMDKNMSYGSIYKRREEELCDYYTKSNLIDFNKDLNLLLKKCDNVRTPFALYQILLEINDLFNNGDALGMIVGNERKRIISEVRNISNKCAKSFLKLPLAADDLAATSNLLEGVKRS